MIGAGRVERGYEAVAAAFSQAFEGRPEMGGAVAVRHRGRLVVDLVAGSADARTGRPWTPDTLGVIFSCTKGLVSLLLARLVQEDRIGYDDLVEDVWPEFAVRGKEGTRISDLLAHRAGLSAPRADMTIDDVVHWDRATGLLAAQAPLWPLGAGWTYHAITHGWLNGEIVRRVTGMSVGAYFRRLVGDPLGVDAWIGLPEDRQARVARMWAGPSLRELTARQDAERVDAPHEWLWRAMTLGGALPPELVGDDAGFNDPRILAAEVPGAGGVADARALATIWSATVTETEGIRLLDDAILDLALRPQTEGAPYFDAPPPWPRWGMGFQLGSEARQYLSESSFGHDGAGGQVAFGDREKRVGFAFLTNQMEAVDDRATRIIDALRECL